MTIDDEYGDHSWNNFLWNNNVRFQAALHKQVELNSIYRTMIDKLEKRLQRVEDHVQRLEAREDIRSAADKLAK